MDKREMKKDVICGVFQSVIEYHEQELIVANPQERTPYTPIAPQKMQQFCTNAGATDVEVAQILSFCVSVIGGILSSSDYANTLKADNMGEIIVQIENIKAIK